MSLVSTLCFAFAKTIGVEKKWGMSAKLNISFKFFHIKVILLEGRKYFFVNDNLLFGALSVSMCETEM